MRALDCKDPATHADVHFTGPDDQDLVGQVKDQIREIHPGMSPDEAEVIVRDAAYDER